MSSSTPIDATEAKSGNYPAMRFGGKILYSKTANEVDKRAVQLLKDLETKRDPSGRAIVGFDIECRPSFKKGVLRRKVNAVVQICIGNDYCDVMHIIHSGIPQSLKHLIEDSTLVKVGVGINGDSVKLFHDHGVSIKDVEDLSVLASKKLSGDSRKQWGLASFTKKLMGKKLILKPKSAKLGNWEVHPLSEKQLQYAANDAYASWHLYQVLKDLPDAGDMPSSEGNGSSKSPNRAPEQYNTMDGSFGDPEHIQEQHEEENNNTDTAQEEAHHSSNEQTKKRRKRGSRYSNVKKRSKTVHGESKVEKQMKTETGAKKQTKRKSNEKKMKTLTREGKIFSRRKSLEGAGTTMESGVRRSTRIKSRPLKYWRGERFLCGRIHESLTTVIGIKYGSPEKRSNEKRTLKVKSFVSDKCKELVDFAALH